MRTIKEQRASIQLHDGLQEVKVEGESLHLDIRMDKRQDGQLLVTYYGSRLELHVTLHLSQACNVSILFLNELQEACTMHLEVIGERDAQAHIGIGDLSASKASYDLSCALTYPGMHVHMTSVAIAKEKNWKLKMLHEAANTSGLMENFAVVEDGGSYQMEAIGQIKKGAYASASHQASRVLTMSQNQQSSVTPVLLIDENDVKASHAMTIGQPDENQLYYLQSRGLSRRSALGLLTLGYLMPICEVINDEAIRTRIQTLIEERVIIDV